MSLTQQLINQCVELKDKYREIVKLRNGKDVVAANKVIMALYGITCACIVSSINKVSGEMKIDVAINAKGFSDLGGNKDLISICDLVKENIYQIISIMEMTEDNKRISSVGKLAVEIANAIDQGNDRLHGILKNVP